MLLETIFLICLIALSAFFSATEVAFLSISSIRLNTLLEMKAIGAENLARLRANRRKVIIAILIGNNLVNITASAITTQLSLNLFGEEGIGIAIGITTFLILTFGEIIPKSFATMYGEAFILFCAPILEAFYYTIYPLIVVFEFINKLVPGVYARTTIVERFEEADVRSAVRLSAKNKGITEQERILIENVLEFNDRTVGDAMTPRSRVVFIDGRMKVADAHQKVLKNYAYSRFPVILNRQVIGTVSVKILGRALYETPNLPVAKVSWKPVKINVKEKASVAFSKLQKMGRNIAIVVDDKNNFVGVVTLEDLLEELVGEINKFPSFTKA